MLIRVDRERKGQAASAQFYFARDSKMWRGILMCAAGAGLAATLMYRAEAQQPSTAKQTSAKQTKAAVSPNDPRTFLNTYCLGCHSAKLRTAGLDLESIDAAHPEARAEIWEKVITRLRAGSMPPAGVPRPDAKVYDSVATSLESTLDK